MIKRVLGRVIQVIMELDADVVVLINVVRIRIQLVL